MNEPLILREPDQQAWFAKWLRQRHFLNWVTLIRRRGDGKEFSIGGRAILSRTQSTDAIITRDINLRELENAEARGVNNKTFSEIYEENDGNVEDGSFMVANPQLALKNNELEYMKEVRGRDWWIRSDFFISKNLSFNKQIFCRFEVSQPHEK